MTEETPELTPAQIAARLRAIDERLDRGAEKMDQQSEALANLTSELKRNSETTDEVRQLLDLGRSGLKVLGWLGSGAKFLGALVGTFATAALAVYGLFYAITHGGQMPPKP